MMRRFLKGISLFVPVAVLAAAVGCSTISRTEKQLSKVDSYDSPDIPAIGEIPPVRPRPVGLAYSSENSLIVFYDENVGLEPLRKAIRKYGARVTYDYGVIHALALKMPDGKDIDDAAAYFRKVKGVLEVSRDHARYSAPSSEDLF